jgi:hypothetical protein
MIARKLVDQQGGKAWKVSLSERRLFYNPCYLKYIYYVTLIISVGIANVKFNGVLLVTLSTFVNLVLR